MSTIGSPIETSLLQTAQAQQTASKARDKEKARTDAGRRYEDQVDLKVAGVESAEALRELPHSESEQAEQEQRGQNHLPPDVDADGVPRLDVTA